jgi:hypothetical protein
MRGSIFVGAARCVASLSEQIARQARIDETAGKLYERLARQGYMASYAEEAETINTEYADQAYSGALVLEQARNRFIEREAAEAEKKETEK